METNRIIAALDTLPAADLRQVHQRAGELLALVEGWQQPDADQDHTASAGHYRQEYTKCSKPGCKACTAGQGHGPYWYHYYHEQGKLKKKYIRLNDVPAALRRMEELQAATQRLAEGPEPIKRMVEQHAAIQRLAEGPEPIKRMVEQHAAIQRLAEGPEPTNYTQDQNPQPKRTPERTRKS